MGERTLSLEVHFVTMGDTDVDSADGVDPGSVDGPAGSRGSLCALTVTLNLIEQPLPRGAGIKCYEADDTGAHVVALYFAHCPFR